MPPLLRFLLAVCLLACVRVAVADDGDAEHWRALARDDLEFIHKTLLEAHPGAIDDANPAFGRWMEEGYRESLALLPQVHDYGTFLNAVRAYVTGFRDGHLGVSDDGRRADVLVASKGFGVGLRHDRYVVTAVAANWPAPLPPVGARLLACDGRAPQDIIAEDVAPYRDRRDLASSRKQIAALLGEPIASMGGRLRTCTFAGDDGRTLALDLVYRNVPFADWAPLMNSGTRPVAPTNGHDLRDGLLWIRAQNFQPDREQYAALEAMLRELRQIKGAQSIVFDVRHNGGGNSAVGDMIFDAATGGLRFDRDGIRKLPPVYAEWRVSDVSIGSAKARLADALRVYGHASDETAWLREHLRSLLVARAEGRRFVRQDTGEHRVTRADVARRHGRLRNFTGRIAVLTDDSCASACLDFVDEVRLVPGSLHLGATTSADSVYIDVGIVGLPSGNRLMMPLKVWRNRLRGDNEPYVPDVAFDGDLDDDAAVRAFVVDALARHAKASDMR